VVFPVAVEISQARYVYRCFPLKSFSNPISCGRQKKKRYISLSIGSKLSQAFEFHTGDGRNVNQWNAFKPYKEPLFILH